MSRLGINFPRGMGRFDKKPSFTMNLSTNCRKAAANCKDVYTEFYTM